LVIELGSRRSVTLVAAAAIAWLGMLAHNILSLPLSPLSPENVGPLLVWAGLLGVYVLSRGANAARFGLLVWTSANLVVGGILSVLPLPIWPWSPEQTVGHYAAHAMYALAQVPLLWLLLRPGRLGLT